ncbi:MAG: hypothetical protein KDC45_02830 [Bacteroidetes bacterium]|nr:hypothetical protein [Bacteroidota bacterium]
MNIILKSFKQAFSFYKLYFLVWFLSLLAAWPLFSAIQNALAGNLGMTNVPGEWLQNFNLGYLFEIAVNQPSLAWMTTQGVRATAIVFVLVAVLTSAGTFGIFRELSKGPVDGRFLANFLRLSGTFFGRFFRIGLWVVTCVLLALLPLMAGSIGAIIAVPLVSFILINADVTRIRVVENGEKGMTRHFFTTMPFVLRNLGVFIGYYLVSVVTIALGLGLYRLLDNFITPASVSLIFLMVMIQQSLILFRSTMRIQIISMATMLYDKRKPLPVPEEPVIQLPTNDSTLPNPA